MSKRQGPESGFTLVELLGAIAIFSILVALVFQVLHTGINASNKAKEGASLQREANIILSALTTRHETESSYTILLDQNPSASKISIRNETGEITVISQASYFYTIYNDTTHELLPTEAVIEPNNDESLSIRLIVEDAQGQSFEISTIISRM
ncbi:prepilin-type N-terminal cleavage/methylation domain-containing protein [Radiobacillus kanasensis]|uniref:PulJ/GspJ family protein n=1 Tax=Radiobacillus kanasensis TaxID=2844358 RepID=UPI001E552570|nr:prepilin-type N-terminal cleavage/methylation domain-containing protein [Radiobacillus kanasensis]UFT99118.1 prepilin-type N-terminal cleavage/methylation domain-containing protein [Radiobacillus kanasensis]